MTRRAILVANTISYSYGERITTPPLMTRTLELISGILQGFPKDYAFEVTSFLDRKPEEVLDGFRYIADKTAKENDLLLFYYFGHGQISIDPDLLFIHPGGTEENPATLALGDLEYTLRVVKAQKSLFVLDCCYSGVRTQSPISILSQQHCRLASTTPSGLARFSSGDLRNPVGEFTQAIITGLTTGAAVVSNTSNNITAKSLFDYAYVATQTKTSGVQEPTFQGNLNEAITEYLRAPAISPEIMLEIDEKTSYRKIYALLNVIHKNTLFPNVQALHKAVLREHLDSFRTFYKKEDGEFHYRAVKIEVIQKYLSFLRKLGFLSTNEISLTPRGRNSIKDNGRNFNVSLNDALQQYLVKNGLSLEILDEILNQILSGRRVPYKQDVFDTLTLDGFRYNKSELSVVLDLLGYIGAFRMSSQRAFFPWTA